MTGAHRPARGSHEVGGGKYLNNCTLLPKYYFGKAALYSSYIETDYFPSYLTLLSGEKVHFTSFRPP